jgi:uncharacterized protein
MKKLVVSDDVAKRLKRAHGHLQGVLKMVDEGRSCEDIVQQLQAVEKALSTAKRNLIQDHIHHCIEQAVNKGELTASNAVNQFKEIAKYL